MVQRVEYDFGLQLCTRVKHNIFCIFTHLTTAAAAAVARSLGRCTFSFALVAAFLLTVIS